MTETATVDPAPAPAPAAQAPSLPPGPRLPLLLQSQLTWRWMVPFMTWAQRRYGDVFSLRILPWGRTVVVGDPEMIKQIVTGPPDVFMAGKSNGKALERALGSRGLLVIDEEEHLETRKAMLPPFHGEAVQAYAGMIREVTEERVEQWPVGAKLSMHEESRLITLEIILRAVFGAEHADSLPELREVLGTMTHIPMHIMLWYAEPRLELVPPWRGYSRAIRRANELIDELIAQRRRTPDLDRRSDILSILIRSGNNDDNWLRDQVMNLLAAGHETTTTGLAWATELLARHPEAREKARDGDDAYLDAVVTETLRLRTVVPGVARKLAAPATVGDYRLPAGVTVLGGGALLHRDPRIYDEPEAFRPERWLERRPGTYTWFPFGGGRRRCIGASFAQMEMRVVLRTILDMADWKPASRRPEKQKSFHITLVPARGARIVRTR